MTRPVAVAVHHLAAPDRAERLADRARARRCPAWCELYVSELGAAIGAHVGPGAVGVVIAPSPAQADRARPAARTAADG